MSFKLLFSIIFVSILLSASFLAYRLFLVKPDSSMVITDSTSGVVSQGLLATGEDGEIDPDEAEYSRLLSVMSSIGSLNTAFLNQAPFIQLVDFTYTLPAVPSGRPNPFAPIGAVPAATP